MRLLIMGPPGAGKGTQAVDLAARVGGAHISTGDIFRANVSQGTPLGVEAKKYMDAGQYVPDEVTNAMVRDRLAQDDAKAFVLDGYPRTADQVSELDNILEGLGAKLDGVLELMVADREELVQRMIKRAETSGRADDTEEVIRHRQDVYDQETAALVPIYRERGLLHEIDGIGSIDEVAQRIASVVDSLQG
ncbi:adenylate kinase [Nocardioides baekrokdamisoli]|uniref:Adenylate kinase n=1 Tax=Nocardioides baekrokdamisoli TaxID=1804624 RepID=A0A3G9J4G8_9ACTN|nr:adenylate kinase [Nocardioides baekrokdamisoli]BBH17919.1 adenylate kinase [Nocardioides baekrokdamisoli]